MCVRRLQTGRAGGRVVAPRSVPAWRRRCVCFLICKVAQIRKSQCPSRSSMQKSLSNDFLRIYTSTMPFYSYLQGGAGGLERPSGGELGQREGRGGRGEGEGGGRMDRARLFLTPTAVTYTSLSQVCCLVLRSRVSTPGERALAFSAARDCLDGLASLRKGARGAAGGGVLQKGGREGESEGQRKGGRGRGESVDLERHHVLKRPLYSDVIE